MAALGLSCSMQDLVPWPVVWTPALGAWSLSQWTTREIPHSFINSTGIWVLSICLVLILHWLYSRGGCSSLTLWSCFLIGVAQRNSWCSGVYVLLFSEPTQVLEYLRILNGAKFRWTHGGREGRSAGWWGERMSGQEWSGHGSALGLLISSESGSSVLKVILQHCWLMKKCPSQKQISRFCLLLPVCS